MDKDCNEVSGGLNRGFPQVHRIHDHSPEMVIPTAAPLDQDPGKSVFDENDDKRAVLLYAHHMHYARQNDEQWRLFCAYLMHMYLKKVTSFPGVLPVRSGLGEESRLSSLPDDILHILLEYFDGKTMLFYFFILFFHCFGLMNFRI